jgi:ribose-phosphate pyrophosphokinase
MSKYKVLHSGGLAIVTTPNMEYMAREAYGELRQLIKKKSLAFHMMEYKRFSREEIKPKVGGNVRRKHVYLFYDFNGDSCHDAFVLQLTISAIQGAGADSITLVVPYLPFMRQDWKDESRVPISAKDFITGYERFEKVERTISLDIHALQTQGVFDRRSDLLPGYVVFEPWIQSNFGDKIDDIVIFGPDAGAEKRVRQLAKRVGCAHDHLIKDKTTGETKVDEARNSIVSGKVCILNDDIIDSGGTIVGAVQSLKNAGAAEVHITATHPVFGGKAYENLAHTGCQVVVSDSLKTKSQPWLEVLTLSRYLAHAILQNEIEEGSVSTIIEKGLPD